MANLADDNARLAITEIDVSALPGDAAAWSDDDRTITFDPGTAFQSLAQDETTSVEIAYTVSDDQGFSDDAVLTVTVTGVNDDPTLAAGVLAANEDGAPVELDLSTLGDDIDGDDDGATLAYAVTGAPAEGSASISGTTLTFGPGADFQDLAEGETRDVTIELTATDRHGATAVNDVTVTVTGVNDDPTLTAGVLAASEDGAPVELDLSTLGDDVDGDDDGATLAYAVTGGPAEGSASISGTTLTFDPGADFQDLAAGETRDVIVQVTATDKHGATAVNGVTVTVTGTNDAPIAQDVELVANVTGNSTFENGFDGWTQVSTPQTGPNGERIASDYSYSFRIDQSQNLIPGDGHVADIAFSGWLAQYRDGPNRGTVYGPSLLSDPFAGSAGDIVTFEYRAFSGGDAASITAELVNVDTGAVTPVFFEQTPAGQTSPVRQIEVPISQAGNYRIEFTVGSFDQSDGGFVGARLAIGTAGIVRSGVAEGDVQVFEALQFTRDATDVDNGAIITLEGTDAVSALGAAVSIDGDGNVRYDAAAVTALAAHETAIDTFDFTVRDEHGATGTATASIRLVGRNDDPTMAAGALAASEDGAPVELDLAALGEDVDSDDDGTTLSYAVTGGLAEGSASITGTTLTFDPGADFQDLAEGETRAVTVQVTATDRHGATAVNDVTVTVTGVNDGPMANDDGPFTVAEDGTVRIAFTDLLANDMDVDGDALTIDSFDFGNTAGKVTDNGDGTLTYDPNGAFDSLNTGDTGADSFTYRVTDGNGGTAEAAVALSIEGNGPVGTVLGFDDLGGGSVPDGYGGLNWHNARVLDPSNEYPDSGYLRGITSGNYVAYNSFAREMNVSHASGDEFDFLGATLTAAWNDNINVEITGFRDGQQVEFERVVVSDDEPTEFLLNWRDVDALRFVSYGGTDAGTIGTGTHFAMDDFIIA